MLLVERAKIIEHDAFPIRALLESVRAFRRS
jgi:hypothetical protein